MASFLTSALGGVNNLSNLVDRVSQLKDNIERTLDSAVGESADGTTASLDSMQQMLLRSTMSQSHDDVTVRAVNHLSNTEVAGIRDSSSSHAETADRSSVQAINLETPLVHEGTKEHAKEGAPPLASSVTNTVEHEPSPIKEIDEARDDPPNTTTDNDAPGEEETIGARERELRETLKRREVQLEKASRQLAEQEEQLQAMREALASDKRVRAAEARAEQLMKEGLTLSEKQGKAEQALRKVRKEKEELETKERALAEQLKREQEARAALQGELNELRDVRKRGETSLAQIAESNAEAARRLEEARTQASQAVQREQDMKTAMERTFSEVAELKKQVASLTQLLNAAKRDAEHARYQLKEQLDSKQLHGSRADSVERSLAEAKAALEEQTRESRMLEADLRAQLTRMNDQLHQAERRAEEAAKGQVGVTVPLFRQIEQLTEQCAKSEQASSALLTRAVAAEAAEVEAVHARRKAEQARAELAIRVSELETQISATKADTSRFISDLKITQKRAEELEKERDGLQRQLDQLRSSTDAKMAEHRVTEMNLRQMLALEAEKAERTKRTWEEKLRDTEDRHHLEMRKARAEFGTVALPTGGAALQASPAAPPVPGSTTGSSSALRRFNSDAQSSILSGSAMTATQEEILGSVLFGDDFSSANPNGGHLGDAINEGASSKYLLQTSELQAGIRRRDARIKILADQVDHLSKQKDDMGQRLALLQAKIEALQAAGEREIEAIKEVAALKVQNSLLMEMLGEKEEQLEALSSDMEDVKAKFREQLEILLSSK